MRRTGLMLYIYPIDKFYIGRHKSSKKSHEIPIRHRLIWHYYIEICVIMRHVIMRLFGTIYDILFCCFSMDTLLGSMILKQIYFHMFFHPSVKELSS